MNIANDINNANMQAQNENIDPNTGKVMTLEQQYELSLIQFKEEMAKAKKENENLVGKMIKRDADFIKLSQESEQTKQSLRLLENRHYSQIQQNITEESHLSKTDPESIIQNTFMAVASRKAEQSKAKKEQRTYWLT